MKKYLAECIGTFTLVLFGCGAAVIAGASVGVLGIACAFVFEFVATLLFLIVPSLAGIVAGILFRAKLLEE
jgi:glycerol uptake facilitator-like aquaporin